MKKTIFVLLLSAVIVGPSLAAETRYITDEFEVTMRSGTSTSNSIIRMLRSGEAVTVLEEDQDTKYSLVQTRDDRQGYVLSRFLMNTPAARQTLAELQADYSRQQERIEEQVREIEVLNQALAREKSDNGTLKNTLRASEQELDKVRDAAQNTLNILEQNNRLKTVVEELRQQQAALTDENAELKDTTKMDWFVRGAAVSLAAFVIGILVTRIRWRKQDSWGSY